MAGPYQRRAPRNACEITRSIVVHLAAGAARALVACMHARMLVMCLKEIFEVGSLSATVLVTCWLCWRRSAHHQVGIVARNVVVGRLS